MNHITFHVKRSLKLPAIHSFFLRSMENKAIKRILIEYVDQLLAPLGDHLKVVSWFGSTARGKATEDSDIDVLVLTDTEERSLRDTAFDISADISLTHDCVISVLFMSQARYSRMVKAGRLLARNIESDGIRLWQRTE